MKKGKIYDRYEVFTWTEEECLAHGLEYPCYLVKSPEKVKQFHTLEEVAGWIDWNEMEYARQDMERIRVTRDDFELLEELAQDVEIIAERVKRVFERCEISAANKDSKEVKKSEND